MATKKTKKIESPLRIGNAVYVCMVTYHVVGRVVLLTAGDVVLDDASWIGDPGARMYNVLKDGKLEECEPFPDPVLLGRGAIVDATTWRHALPREQK